MVKAKRSKTEKVKRPKKRLTEATVVVPPVEQSTEVAQENTRDSPESTDQAEASQEAQPSRPGDKHPKQRSRQRSRERERSVQRDVSRLRKSRRSHESPLRQSPEKRRSYDSRKRDNRRGSGRYSSRGADDAEWDDLTSPPKRNHQRRYARSVEQRQNRGRDAWNRDRTRSGARSPYRRSLGHGDRGATLMDVIRSRVARRHSGRNREGAPKTVQQNSPSRRVGRPERGYSRRSPRLCERWDRERSYSEPYHFPTRQRGDFAQAMSAIARNLPGTDQRTDYGNQDFESKFHEQVSHALALKLNLSTQQHANEKALGVLRKNGGERCNLKQTLQARAAIYDSGISPTWFDKEEALNSKAKTPKLRRAAC